MAHEGFASRERSDSGDNGRKLSEERRRVDCLNIIVAGEVARVECENPANTVDVHGCDEFCVVDFAAQHAVLDDEPLPLRIDSGRIRQDRQEPLDLLQFA